MLVRQAEAKAGDLPRAKLITSKGEIIIELFENESPATVGNFISLVKDGFYKDIKFHRVISGFMAQTGCPEGTGSGGPGYKIYDECTNPEARRHFTGSLSMAKENPPHTGGSQFFISHKPSEQFDGKYTAFGRVKEGMDVIYRLQTVDKTKEDPAEIQPSKIIRATVVWKRDHKYEGKRIEKTAPQKSAADNFLETLEKQAGSDG